MLSLRCRRARTAYLVLKSRRRWCRKLRCIMDRAMRRISCINSRWRPGIRYMSMPWPFGIFCCFYCIYCYTDTRNIRPLSTFTYLWTTMMYNGHWSWIDFMYIQSQKSIINFLTLASYQDFIILCMPRSARPACSPLGHCGGWMARCRRKWGRRFCLSPSLKGSWLGGGRA